MEPFHRFDLHVHTPFSDGQYNISVILEKLIDLGIKIVGLSDHIFPFSIYKHSRKSDLNPKGFVNNYLYKQLEYRKNVIKFYDKKYKRIHVLNGAEIDILPQGTLTLPKGITPDFFDYLLVAKHHTLPKQLNILYKNTPKIEKWMWKYNPRLRLNRYLWEKGLYRAFTKYTPDIFAHPQVGMPRHLPIKIIKRLLLYCKKFNVAFELNHFPKDKEFRKFLEYGHQYGVKFSLASDFHGFKKNIKELLNHSQEMYSLAEKFDLKLINPYKFLKE